MSNANTPKTYQERISELQASSLRIRQIRFKLDQDLVEMNKELDLAIARLEAA